MFIHFGDQRCPLCGTNGTPAKESTFSCPKCLAAFTNYGLIVAPHNEDEVQNN